MGKQTKQKTSNDTEIAMHKTMGNMIDEAQVLYDKDNWGGLSDKERERFNYLKSEYRKIRNVEIPLTYNCPA